MRRLVEFLLRSGDIDAEGGGRRDVEAMLAGSEIHRTLQAAGGEAYQAEVSLACSVFFPEGSFSPHAARLDIAEEAVARGRGYFLHVEGRADGIIDDGTQPLVIDEIKGVTRDVSDIHEPEPLHEAQALCYAYLHLRSTRGPSALAAAHGQKVVVRLTYVSMTTGEVRQIERTHTPPEIEAWFFSLLEKAQRWASWRVDHDARRDASLSSLAFPLVPRDGQRELMDAVEGAIRKGERLYVQAPTGSGKTLATLYPALKAIGSGETSRVAYLTAKTTTRGPVLESIDLLGQRGLSANVLVVTARDKICPLRSRTQGTGVRARPLASLCNPFECPLARGHYDHANDALFEAITTCDLLDLDAVRKVAKRHHACPYELQRDLARWADVVVCDYHYAFAPSASLLGLADEPGAGTVLLVDEAHNLVERMREMYSAELALSDLKALERLLGDDGTFEQLARATRATIAAFPTWDKALPPGRSSGPKGKVGRPSYQVVTKVDELIDALSALSEGIGAALEQPFWTQDATNAQGHGRGMEGSRAVELYLALRDMGFAVAALLGAFGRNEGGYVAFLGKGDSGGPKLEVFCVNPAHDLGARLEEAKAAVFFSGTLLPLDYHRKLLGAQDEDASLYVRSSFDHNRQQVLVGSDLSARYAMRGPELYARVAAYLVALMRARPGNYLAFLPSYAMVEEVAQRLGPLADGTVTVMRQAPGMREADRQGFVDAFREPHGPDASLLGLCVLGGIFGESIDLPGEALVGVVVVGTGMPPATSEREVIRDYFDVKQGKGFAYAYTYPGLIKVLQAAGRLMRTEHDHGVVLLLDDRFLEDELQQAFPREWQRVQACTLQTLPGLLS